MKKKPTFSGVMGFQTPALREPRRSNPTVTVTVASTDEGKVTITAVLRPSPADPVRPLNKTTLNKIERAVRSAVLGQLKLAHGTKAARGVLVVFANQSVEPAIHVGVKRTASKSVALSVSSTRPPPPPKK